MGGLRPAALWPSEGDDSCAGFSGGGGGRKGEQGPGFTGEEPEAHVHLDWSSPPKTGQGQPANSRGGQTTLPEGVRLLHKMYSKPRQRVRLSLNKVPNNRL